MPAPTNTAAYDYSHIIQRCITNTAFSNTLPMPAPTNTAAYDYSHIIQRRITNTAFSHAQPF